jgi:SHS2 domain-containing protein
MPDRISHHKDGAWEVYAHGADIGIRGYGLSRDRAFEEAAYALTAAGIDPGSVRRHDVVDIVCNAASDALLLQEWLAAVLREMDRRSMLFSRYAVTSLNHGLTARAWGEAVDEERHRLTAKIRAIADAGLEVARDTEGNWMAQCVVEL